MRNRTKKPVHLVSLWLISEFQKVLGNVELEQVSHIVDCHSIKTIKTLKFKIYKTQQFISPVNGSFNGKIRF